MYIEPNSNITIYHNVPLDNKIQIKYLLKQTSDIVADTEKDIDEQ